MTTKTLTCEIPTAAIKAAILFAATDDIRKYLVGACVEHSPQGVRLIATDGHRMLVQRIAIADETSETTRYVVSLEVLKAAVKLAGALKHGIVSCIWTQDTNPDATRPGVQCVSCATITLHGISTVDVQDDFGKFPVWDRLPPREPSGVLAQFNVMYLADCGKARGLLLGKGKEYVSIGHNGSGPALVPLTDDAFAVVMPMRGDTEFHLPAWMDSKASKTIAQAA